MLFNLQIHCQNVNSLVRASSTENNLTIPILGHLLKSNCIQILCDTRINNLKFEKIRSILCKSNQIGVEKERFFTTLQDSSKMGGVSIYLPQYLDSCLSVIYTKADLNEIPRLDCKLQNTSTILICGYYGSAKSSEKHDSLRRLLSHLEELNEKFSFEHLILGGDFNLILDSISSGNCQESKVFNEILSSFNLVDSKICGNLPNEQETKNMRYNGLDAILSKDACTYLPSIAKQKSNRIDGIYLSCNLQMKCEKVGYCITLELPSCDHRGVLLTLTWQSIGVPCDNIKPDFFFSKVTFWTTNILSNQLTEK